MDYVLAGNANSWKVDEFEECLLDWLLDALTRPDDKGSHLLLERIEDIAFQALRHILATPGQISRVLTRKPVGRVRHFFQKLCL